MFCPPKNQELQLAITGPLAAHSLVEKKHGFPFWGPRDPRGAHSTAVEKRGLRPYWGKTWDAFCNSILPICGEFICKNYIYVYIIII